MLRNEARAAEFTAEADRIDDALARVDQGSSGDHEIFEKLDRDVPSDNVSNTRARLQGYVAAVTVVMGVIDGALTSFTPLPRTTAPLQSAVLVISADAGNLGIILSANAGASKLFGYMRSELEFRSVSMLMPAAIGRMHDTFMRRYMKSGDGEIVSDADSMVPARLIVDDERVSCPPAGLVTSIRPLPPNCFHPTSARLTTRASC